MTAATSPTHTGWNRACGQASGSSGKRRARPANRLRKLSPGPKTTEGRRIVGAILPSPIASSPAAFERR